MSNIDCVHFDYGETCPTAYGGFCKLTSRVAKCKGCKDYDTASKKTSKIREIIESSLLGCTCDNLNDEFGKLEQSINQAIREAVENNTWKHECDSRPHELMAIELDDFFKELGLDDPK